MEQRLANTWRLTVNEKKFIETALQSDLRIDGRRPFDYRKVTIKFGKEDGSAEVQLGHTHVMAFVTAQLVQPYRDRPNEGTLAIYTEFSPMADPSFEPGRPGESAVELGRVIDRGLRESRAVDTESLCVLSGKLVWAIRVDLHILDNGGNLVDAANIAALAALLTFRRPDCSLGGEDGQEVIVHPPEVREPLPLIIHHLPIAVSFAFFGNESGMVIDPTHHEEAVMCGRMTATLNANGDVCAIQKAGGEGVLQSVIMHCLRIASVKAGDITENIKKAVDSYNIERALKKVKRHSTSKPMDVDGAGSNSKEKHNFVHQKGINTERLKPVDEERNANQNDNKEDETKLLETNRETKDEKNFIGAPSSWDPYSKGVDSDFLKASLASRGMSTANRQQKDSKGEKLSSETRLEEHSESVTLVSPPIEVAQAAQQANGEKTLKDAVKPKNKRKKKKFSGAS
ncbi:exosome complex component RRP45A isoform X1 [Ziziphus jujuba]|uniref:Exosome complex component RRP45A isoform X1 n=1 Tax=Ziziphus jujuba TaxID=326968 RepID=A0A6P3ZKR4_ZIZJJ|nr:exosome complex component RRP45A isoform X1 [Ziziphus jujuba]